MPTTKKVGLRQKQSSSLPNVMFVFVKFVVEFSTCEPNPPINRGYLEDVIMANASPVLFFHVLLKSEYFCKNWQDGKQKQPFKPPNKHTIVSGRGTWICAIQWSFLYFNVKFCLFFSGMTGEILHLFNYTVPYFKEKRWWIFGYVRWICTIRFFL